MNTKPHDFWLHYTMIRWRLQRFIKEKFTEVNWQDFPMEYRTGKFDEIHSSLISKWEETEEETRASDSWTDGKSVFGDDGAAIRLKGALYEALFYLTWIKVSTLLKGIKIDNIISRRKAYEPDRFEIVPLLQPFPLMFYDRGRRMAPQIDADFLLLYTAEEEKEVHRPIFIDVKSSEQETSDRLKWQAMACTYMDSLMQVVWPLKKYPKEIEDWESRSICYDCGNLSRRSDKCDKCATVLTWATRLSWNEQVKRDKIDYGLEILFTYP